jgi:lysophospholipase L1-like esterase
MGNHMKRRAFLAAALALATVPLAQPAHAAARLALPAHPRVLLVGDSYTYGGGAVPLSEGYAYKVAAPLGWDLTRDGAWGTGYVNPGTQGLGRFGDRLWKHPADAYSLVVIQGSSNDERYDSGTVKGGVNMTVRTVQRRYPHAQLLLVGLTTPYGSPSADRVRVNSVVRGYAAEKGVLFVDPLAERWFVPGDGSWAANPDNGHPSNAGHRRIADRFVQDVRGLTS